MEYLKNIDYYSWYNYTISLFQKKKEYTINDVNSTINKLRSVKESMDSRIENVENNIKKYFNLAKEQYIKKEIDRAKYNIKLKKMYVLEKKRLDSINFNIEKHILSIESFKLMVETADTLRDTAINLKTINSAIDIDKIENVMDELSENHSISFELHDIISDNGSDEFNIDEEDLLEELGEKKKEEIKEILILPKVPTNKLIINKEINQPIVENYN